MVLVDNCGIIGVFKGILLRVNVSSRRPKKICCPIQGHSPLPASFSSLDGPLTVSRSELSGLESRLSSPSWVLPSCSSCSAIAGMCEDVRICCRVSGVSQGHQLLVAAGRLQTRNAIDASNREWCNCVIYTAFDLRIAK